MRHLRWFSISLALCCSGCVYFKPQDPVLLTSDPPGAHIILDGEDTGRTTPASFDIAGDFEGDHLLELTKTGYRSELRVLTQCTRTYSPRWIDGSAGPDLPPLPIFWTFGDIFLPFGVRGAIVPGEVYVKLYKATDPLLGFDVLAKKLAQTSPVPPAPR